MKHSTKKKFFQGAKIKEFRRAKDEKEKLDLIDCLCNQIKRGEKKDLHLFFGFIAKNIESDSLKIRKAVTKMTREILFRFPEEEKKAICNFIDRILFMMERHYKEEYGYFSGINDLPPSVYKSLEILLNRVLFSKEKVRVIYKNYLSRRSVPYWFDCTWKRVGCGKKECPVCGKSRRNKVFLHQEIIFQAFRKEEMEKIKKKPPKPEKFSLYREAKTWRDDLFDIAEEADHYGDFWVFTVVAADLFWYSSLLVSKCDYQLQNRFYINHGYGGIDYDYTDYVVKDCIDILKKSLKKTISLEPRQADELEDLLFRFLQLEDKLKKI